MFASKYSSEYGLSFKSPSQSGTEHYICVGQQKRKVEYIFIEGLPTLSIESFTDNTLDLSNDIQVIPY
jgi:hypothetical protein